MILQLEKVAFTYPGAAHPALQSLTLALDTGRVTVLAGSNGAGKSTLIKLLTGQLLGFEGGYTIDGQAAEVLSGELLARNRFGYAPEVPVLDPYLTGSEVLDLVGELRGMSSGQVEEQVRVLREAFDLGEWLEDQVCDAYSKGMRKKASLGVALLGDMPFAFLDEPFDGLDPISIYRLKSFLQERRERGLGVLLSSHLLDVAEKIADDVILLKEGRVLYQGSYAALTGGNEGRTTSLDEVYFQLYSHDGENARRRR